MAGRKQVSNDFYSKVYEVTKLIPYGRVTSYGAIARYLGTGRSARMVGWALNSCHNNEEFIPAYRVVNRNGLLTGNIISGTQQPCNSCLRMRASSSRMIKS
jgi:methylated-DNA-protein-cysteine methyltransferase-like protein